jgi:hypothetical protein
MLLRSFVRVCVCVGGGGVKIRGAARVFVEVSFLTLSLRDRCRYASLFSFLFLGLTRWFE